MLATTLLTGDVCTFSWEGYSRGNNKPFGGRELALAKAVAASSAFPLGYARNTLALTAGIYTDFLRTLSPTAVSSIT